jgi:hypothetical protein
MSTTIDYFFNHPDNLADIAKSINPLLGCSLAPYEGDVEDFFCRFFGMEFSLSEHTLDNDRECNFEDYRFHIGFRVPVPDGDLRVMQVPTIALVIYILFSRMGVTGMLVYNIQTLLGRYEERILSEESKGDLYDVVSNELVSFPEHFATLQKRIQKTVS